MSIRTSLDCAKAAHQEQFGALVTCKHFEEQRCDLLDCTPPDGGSLRCLLRKLHSHEQAFRW